MGAAGLTGLWFGVTSMSQFTWQTVGAGMAQQHRTKKQSAASRKQRRETLLARMGWRMKKPRTGHVEIQSDEIPIFEGIAPYVNGYLEGYIDGQEQINAKGVSIQDWHTMSQKSILPVAWDGDKREYFVALKGVLMMRSRNPDDSIEMSFKPPVLYDVRLRKKGEEWGPGFLVPYNQATFVGLEPNTEYEGVATPVDESGKHLSDLPPQTTNFRT